VITICPDLYNYVEQLVPASGKNFCIENSIFEPVRLANQDIARPEKRCLETAVPVPIPKDFQHKIVYAGTPGELPRY